jgi:hypothetical protein
MTAKTTATATAKWKTANGISEPATPHPALSRKGRGNDHDHDHDHGNGNGNGKMGNGFLNTPKLAKQVPPLFNQKGK